MALSGNTVVKSSFLFTLGINEYFDISTFNTLIISVLLVQALLTHVLISLDKRKFDGFIVFVLLVDNVVPAGFKKTNWSSLGNRSLCFNLFVSA